VKFTKGEQIVEGARYDNDKETIFREQIHRAIQDYFER
jgi:hypothetical protein